MNELKYLSVKSGTREIEESYHKILLHETEIKDNFYQYLAGGGFTELLPHTFIKNERLLFPDLYHFKIAVLWVKYQVEFMGDDC